MRKFILDNVERYTDNPVKAKQLLGDGYKEVKDDGNAPGEKEAAAPVVAVTVDNREVLVDNQGKEPVVTLTGHVEPGDEEAPEKLTTDDLETKKETKAKKDTKK